MLKDTSASYKPSNEEKFVQYYLEENGIKFIPQYRLNNLKGDNYKYRDVDFYLPRLNIYVEYYGWYNKSKRHREEYDLKTKVYINNSIPTIVIYPHELGFIDYAFHSKMIKLLNIPKFKNQRKILLYKFNRFVYLGKPYYLALAFVTLIISLSSLSKSKQDWDFNFIIYLLSLSISFLLFAHPLREFYYVVVKNE